MNNRSKKGFTLVEIMIVVVIIGLLAAMAIPAFQQVRKSSIEKTVLNDARQIGSAAQQYMMEYGVTTFGLDVNTTTGALEATCVLYPWLKQISKGTSTASSSKNGNTTDAIVLTKTGAFNGSAAYFNDEGKKTN